MLCILRENPYWLIFVFEHDFSFLYEFQILSVFPQSSVLPSWNLPIWMNPCILGCSVHLFPLNSRFHIGGEYQGDCLLWWCSVTTDAGKAQKATQDVNNALKLLNTTVPWVPKFWEKFFWDMTLHPWIFDFVMFPGNIAVSHCWELSTQWQSVIFWKNGYVNYTCTV